VQEPFQIVHARVNINCCQNIHSQLFRRSLKGERRSHIYIKKGANVKFTPMDTCSSIWTARNTPYLTLILINMAFKWLTKPWLGIWRPYFLVSKSSKWQYRRSKVVNRRSVGVNFTVLLQRSTFFLWRRDMY